MDVGVIVKVCITLVAVGDIVEVTVMLGVAVYVGVMVDVEVTVGVAA